VGREEHEVQGFSFQSTKVCYFHLIVSYTIWMCLVWLIFHLHLLYHARKLKVISAYEKGFSVTYFTDFSLLLEAAWGSLKIDPNQADVDYTKL
jgi:hypothetical protein